jgi:hypothetical protein
MLLFTPLAREMVIDTAKASIKRMTKNTIFGSIFTISYRPEAQIIQFEFTYIKILGARRSLRECAPG